MAGAPLAAARAAADAPPCAIGPASILTWQHYFAMSIRFLASQAPFDYPMITKHAHATVAGSFGHDASDLKDRLLLGLLDDAAKQLAQRLQTDVLAYVGPIEYEAIRTYRDHVESYGDRSQRTERLSIVLTTLGGVVEVVEKLVQITRYHYEFVDFYVPDRAMSAGTIWCMSGDRIVMDYAASLGPVDPQVPMGGSDGAPLVPALGYLDQYNKLIEASRVRTLSDAELALVLNTDLGELNRYEQARELSVELTKRWLIDYKFKHWREHRTDPERRGHPVTPDEKERRAEEIANLLNKHGHWHSHGRMIDRASLINKFDLEIADPFDPEPALGQAVREYGFALDQYFEGAGVTILLHGAPLWRIGGRL